jgi:hypothetical protein
VVRNTGRRPIKTLQITTRWIDADGKELGERTQFVVTGAATAALPAGCQTPFQLIA